MSDLCECGRPIHYEGGHYPDTSQSGMNATWCMCGGLGNFHHGPTMSLNERRAT